MVPIRVGRRAYNSIGDRPTLEWTTVAYHHATSPSPPLQTKTYFANPLFPFP